MRSFVISSVIVCVLIIIWYSFFTYLDTHVESYQVAIKDVKSYIEDEKWEQAGNLQKELYVKIEESKTIYMFFLNHNEVDDILRGLDKLNEFIQTREKGLGLAECANLKILLEHILQKHSLTFVNIM